MAMNRRLQGMNFFPVTAADIAKYRRIGQRLTYFERECLLLGLDPAQFERVEPLEYHEPMDFINKDEQLLPPRRRVSGANVDE